jgi:inhibitor of cysteine peptidase
MDAGGTLADLTLTPENDNATVELHPGDRLIIEVPENATTGFRWYVGPFDESVIQLVGEDGAATDPPGIGAGGIHRFTFEARAPGSTTLDLRHWREWEGDKSILGRLRATVRVA